MSTLNTLDTAPTPIAPRRSKRTWNYNLNLVGPVHEWVIAKVDQPTALYWSTQTDLKLFDHVMAVREDEHEPSDGTPTFYSLPQWGGFGRARWLEGVDRDQCYVSVETPRGKTVYEADLADEDDRWRHTRSQHHFNHWNLVTSGGGCLVAGIEYDDALRFQVSAEQPFDPDKLHVGWSFMRGRYAFTSVAYDGHVLDAETGSGIFKAQWVQLSYRDEAGKMRWKTHEIGEVPWDMREAA